MPAAKKSAKPAPKTSKAKASKATKSSPTKAATKSSQSFPKAPTWFQHMAKYAEKNPAVVLVGGIAVLLGIMLLIG